MPQKKPKKRRPFDRKEDPFELMEMMATQHIDVLENIEFILVDAYRKDDAIDDRIVASALKAAIHGQSPAGQLAAMIFNRLSLTRQQRKNVSDEIWTNGLKVVLESVHTHSDLSSGDTDYLDFAAKYIP